MDKLVGRDIKCVIFSLVKVRYSSNLAYLFHFQGQFSLSGLFLYQLNNGLACYSVDLKSELVQYMNGPKQLLVLWFVIQAIV